MTNFTLQDTLGATRAIAAFTTILLCPGYLLGMAIDLFGFRARTMRERAAWAVALSFGMMPIFTQLGGRVIGIGGVAVVAGMCGIGVVAMLVAERRRLWLPSDKHLRVLGVFLVFGAAVLVAELLDFQFGNRLHMSVTVLDQGYRVGFINAIARGGIPPANPFYHPGGSAPLRYYYFWYTLCAVCMKVAQVSARQALMASSVWAGVGLTAMIALYMRHFLRIRVGLNRQIMTAALLLTVTGADLLPVFYNLFAKNDFGGETEWWSPDQIASWMDTLLWVPNHAAALIGCLTVLLLIWRTLEELPPWQKTAATLLAGVAAASSFGLSIYVTACLAMMLAAWSLRQAWRDRDLSVAQRLVAAALVAAVLLIPYLHDLLAAHSGTEGRGAAGPAHVLAFGVRKMLDPAILSGLPEQWSRLLLLVPGYALELGFAGVVLALAWIDRRRLDEARRTALFLATTGLVIVSLVRSAVIGINDFGSRASLLPCFFLLLLGAAILLDVQDKKFPAQKLRGAVMAPLLLLGLAGTAFQALSLRFYVPIHSSHRAAGFDGLAEAVYDTRVAYGEAARTMPADAIVQSNPTEQGSYFYVANMLFSSRAMATDAAVDCGSVFGGDPSLCQPAQKAIRDLFNLPGSTAAQAGALCTRLGIGYLVAARRDAAWQSVGGWVWTLPAITGAAAPDNAGSIRIVRCGEKGIR